MAEHRVPMLGSSWRRFEDPTRSRDPRVQAVVGALATLPLPAPRPEFRAELRAQLVAITPRIVAEDADIEIVSPRSRPRPTPVTGRPARSGPARHSDRAVAKVRGIRLGRPLAVATSVIVAFAVLLGGAVWMSKKALPGDALYGLKRASESLELATAGSDPDKAQDYLDFATTRAQEVKELLGRSTASAAGYRVGAAGGMDAGTTKLINSTLGSADSDVRSASRLLGNYAVKHASGKALDAMITWAPRQVRRLDAIAASAPDAALRARAEQSAQLVRAALTRAIQLQPQVACSCLGSSGSDELGPKPCHVCNPPPAGQQTTPPQPGSTQPGHNRPTARPTGSGVTAAPHAATVAPGAPASTAPASTPSASSSQPGVTLPSLPLPPPSSSPVTVDSCGAQVSLPILGGIDLNLCNGVGVSIGK